MRPWIWLLLIVVLVGGTSIAVMDVPTVKGRILPPKTPRSGEAVDNRASGQSPALQEWAKVEEAAKREGRVTVYSWSWTPITAAPIVDAFTKRYGIKVEVVAGRGPDFIEMLRLEGKSDSRIGDVMEGAQTHARNATLAGLTVSALELPVLRDAGSPWIFPPLDLDTKGFTIAYSPYVLSPYVNTTLVSASEQPHSWFDLLDPRWKGKMVMPNPKDRAVPYYLDALIRRNAVPQDYLSRLAQQKIMLSEPTPDSGELLGWGRASLSVLNAMPDMVPPLRDGGPIKALDMKEGVLVSALTMALIKDAPHPNAARLFLNWLLTQEGQTVHAKAKLVGSVRKGVPDYTPPAFKLNPGKTIVIDAEEGERVAKAFREKTYLPFFPSDSR